MVQDSLDSRKTPDSSNRERRGGRKERMKEEKRERGRRGRKKYLQVLLFTGAYIIRASSTLMLLSIVDCFLFIQLHSILLTMSSTSSWPRGNEKKKLTCVKLAQSNFRW